VRTRLRVRGEVAASVRLWNEYRRYCPRCILVRIGGPKEDLERVDAVPDVCLLVWRSPPTVATAP
jgi:hypothetical protein